MFKSLSVPVSVNLPLEVSGDQCKQRISSKQYIFISLEVYIYPSRTVIFQAVHYFPQANRLLIG